MKRFYILSLLIITIYQAYSENRDLRIVDSYGVAQGLSHSGVTSLHLDKRGYLWIGTYDGLNQFNGTDIIIYKNRIGGENILPTNRILAINEDAKGRLWIGTEFGMTLYDYDADKFHALDTSDVSRFKMNLSIRNILFSKDEKFTYCITENDGVIVYDSNFNFVSQNSAANIAIHDATIFENDKILFVTDDGLKVYDPILNIYTDIMSPEIDNITCIERYDDSSFLLGLSDGMYLLKYKCIGDNEYEWKLSNRLFSLLDIKHIIKGNKDDLWLTTTQRGVVYIPGFDSQNISNIVAKTYMQDHRISCVLPLENGNAWVGSYNYGFCSLSNDNAIYGCLPVLSKYNAPQIIPMNKAKILIKSDKIAIYDLSKAGSSPQSTLVEFDNILSENKTIAKAPDGNLYIIVEGGIYYIDTMTMKSHRVIYKCNKKDKFQHLPNKPVQRTMVDKYGRLWLSYQNNIYRVKFSDKYTATGIDNIYDHKLLSDSNRGVSRVKTFYQDSNYIYVGSNLRGLYRIELHPHKSFAELKIDEFTHDEDDPSSISSNFVSSIIRTTDNTLWIGTEQGGVCRVEEDGDKLRFKTYSEVDGLSNNVVKSLQCDDKGNLWVATNIGLNMFYPKEERFRIFRTIDNLPFEEFRYSSAKSEDGHLLFSGMREVCYFNPNNQILEGNIPKIYIRNFNIFNREVKPNIEFDGETLLSRRPMNNDRIELKYNQNAFSVTVDALYEIDASNHYIYYRLMPINEEWTRVDTRNNVLNFNALAPDSYTLEIKASTLSDDFSPINSLHIDIKPPFWLSTVAYILYFALTLSVIIGIFVVVLRFQRLRYRLRMEEFERVNIERLNEDKQRYFSNISHELKTPLTLIVAPLMVLVDRFRLDVKIKENLMIIQRQANKMLQLIDLVHDIEMREGYILNPQFSKFIFRDLIKSTTTDFDFFAQYANKNLVVNLPTNAIKVNADYALLEKLLNNLLNNAFKHTDEGDTITLSYEQNDDILILKVNDTGHGISKNDLPNIFSRFFVSQKNKEHNVGGTGIGLSFSKSIVEMHSGDISVDSVEGEWTTFMVRLPIVVEEVEITAPIEHTTKEVESFIIGDWESNEIEAKSDFASSMVYIVEDNDEIRSFVTQILASRYRVQAFTNPLECLSVMENQWPDIIVSDIMMPEMSGEKFCALVKEDLSTSHIPVILLTALNSIDDQIKGLEFGADSYISKPFYPKHLIANIETLLTNRRQLQERYRTSIPTKNEPSQALVSKDAKLLEDLYDLFRKRIDEEDIDFKLIALEFGMNRTTFYAKIKALTDTTPFELLKEYRLQMAADYLQQGEHSVTEVCNLTGFKSRSHFSRLFKTRFGIAPTHYNIKQK